MIYSATFLACDKAKQNARAALPPASVAGKLTHSLTVWQLLAATAAAACCLLLAACTVCVVFQFHHVPHEVAEPTGGDLAISLCGKCRRVGCAAHQKSDEASRHFRTLCVTVQFNTCVTDCVWASATVCVHVSVCVWASCRALSSSLSCNEVVIAGVFPFHSFSCRRVLAANKSASNPQVNK